MDTPRAMSARSLLLSVLVGSVVFACWARTDQTGSMRGDDGGIRVSAVAPADATADAAAAAATPDAAEDGATDGASSEHCSILASSYDESCAIDSDCVAVAEVPLCGDPCSCLTGAINARDQARYSRDLSPLAPPPGMTACHCPCEATHPRCCEGRCTNACGCPSTR